METSSEYTETSTLTFEWTLRGLKTLFDSTKGDKKSKVTKSIRFGNDRWQILCYANAGQQKEGSEGGFISLFLSCEPTPEEKEAALGNLGRWVREGVYRFSFDLRNLSKTVLYNSKEAHNHTFTYKTANWGWPQFARRDSVYYQSMQAKTQDAFVIVCTIISSPTTPRIWNIPRQLIPKNLLDTVGELLDDPSYSDIKFVITKRGRPECNTRAIWASKKMLQRAEYFQTMFSSSFAESSKPRAETEITPKTPVRDLSSPGSTSTSIMNEFEDSDDEDEEIILTGNSNDMLVDSGNTGQELSLSFDESTVIESGKVDSDRHSDARESSPSVNIAFDSGVTRPPFSSAPSLFESSPKTRIEVRDVAYTTYRAMLYYIYTDNIVFAPLSSSFQCSSTETGGMLTDVGPSTPSEDDEGTGIAAPCQHTVRSRAEWIQEWMVMNPGRPAPCSAKSMYRLADRLDLHELKERAAHHIIKSLTVNNIAYEIFSPFAATYETIRKTEVEFFLNHWSEIRSSDVMKNVWVQIRNGRHPGFEEVWPLIAQSLEFRPDSSSSTSPTANAGDPA